MTKSRKLVLVLLSVLLAVSMLVSCTMYRSNNTPDKPIVVLYTNDVHCGYAGDIGYSGLAAYKKAALETTPYVALVDAGDAVQGDVIGTLSEGEYLVDIMNEVGYDLAIFGNHEFDYDTDRLQELVAKAKAQYLCANVKYTGHKENRLAAAKPYEFLTFGNVKVAFIGLSTPESLFKSTPRYFQENGKYVYKFASGEKLYRTAQRYVDEVRALGADYVVVLAHLGLEETSAPNRGTDLAANTHGIDVIIDGHSHSVVESDVLTNDKGQGVLYTQTGTKFENIGVLTIGTDGAITTQLVQPTAKDPAMDKFIANIEKEYEKKVNEVVAHSDINLDASSRDANGNRVVRTVEMPIGDLCADAYRLVSGADIGFANGGGIRADIKKGDITYGNIISVFPYGNYLCVCEATGEEILDALELSAINSPNESGGFLQVSGLKYTINTSIPSPVERDGNGAFTGVSGARRVSDVYVGTEETGWEKIDPAKTYTVACHNYKLQDGGDGYTMFLDNYYPIDKTMIDNQLLISYIVDFLGGSIGTEYSEVKGRITIK